MPLAFVRFTQVDWNVLVIDVERIGRDIVDSQDSAQLRITDQAFIVPEYPIWFARIFFASMFPHGLTAA